MGRGQEVTYKRKWRASLRWVKDRWSPTLHDEGAILPQTLMSAGRLMDGPTSALFFSVIRQRLVWMRCAVPLPIHHQPAEARLKFSRCVLWSELWHVQPIDGIISGRSFRVWKVKSLKPAFSLMTSRERRHWFKKKKKRSPIAFKLKRKLENSKRWKSWWPCLLLIIQSMVKSKS